MLDRLYSRRLPVLPIKSSVLFPGLTIPLSAGRPRSIAAIEAALSSEEKAVVVVAQRKADIEEPLREHLFAVGTRGVIKKAVRSENQMDLLVQGIERVTLKTLFVEPFIRAEAEPLAFRPSDPEIVEALQREMLARSGTIQAMLDSDLMNLPQLVTQLQDPSAQAYLLASLLGLDAERAQRLLEAETLADTLRLIVDYLAHEEQIMRLRQKISIQAATEMSREQREYFLRRQLHAIQQELGEEKPEQAELKELRERLQKAGLPQPVSDEAERELSRLERLPAIAPDYQVVRTRLELIMELPWSKATTDDLDLARARQILDQDHFDLKDVKDRILEHLAVLKLNPRANAPILCFVGPPGTGKTSLGQSIARALGRAFERMSLGGLHDEGELRGHRRTYVGALPGRIIQALRRAKVNNPLLMLDEIDKLARDYRGDPAAALMEILDPAQNSSFHDNYLDLPFDLSKVFFITTANALDEIPRPLLDRMEVLRLSGYTEEEKLEIAKRYLLPRRLEQAGLTPGQFQVPDATIRRVIRGYTREAGLRELERTLGRLARKAAMRFAQGRSQPVAVSGEDLSELLGPERFFFEEARKRLRPGVATGLAWTEAGGEVLYIESAIVPRNGLLMTGNLGAVMKESVQAALSFVLSRLERYKPGYKPPARSGIHVHVPAGATPKDGPSAGLAVAAAIASLYTDMAVRNDTAMTGEITLSGLALPVGGIKEKVLAARRSGIRRVVLPKANENDLTELPDEIRREMEFVLVAEIEQALFAAIPGLNPSRAAARHKNV